MQALTLTSRLAYIVAFITLLFSSAFAQRASDPKAFDLTPYLSLLDSSSVETVYTPTNLGDLNGDGSDDLLLPHQVTDPLQPITQIIAFTHPDGSVTRDTVDVPGTVILAADINGDGKMDLIAADYSHQTPLTSVYWGRGSAPYYDSTRRAILIGSETSQPRFAAQFNRSGGQDIFTTDAQKIFFYPGPNSFETQLMNRADSLSLTSGQDFTYLNYLGAANLRGGTYPSLLLGFSGQTADFSTKTFNISMIDNPYEHSSTLWQSNPRTIFQDTILHSDLFVYTTAITTGDITGDGIDDLIVADSAHLYIFAGGPQFATVPLTKSRASFIITSPVLLDSANFPRLIFAESITVLGDITGTGVPFLAVTNGSIVGSAGLTLLYAGGKALDTYYDAWISYPNESGGHVTPFILKDKPRTFAYTHYLSGLTETRYLAGGTDSIPQVEVPAAVRATPSAPNNMLNLTYRDNDHIIVTWDSPGTGRELVLFDLLGREVYRTLAASAIAMSATTVLDLSKLPHGTYIVVGRTIGGDSAAVPVSH